MASNKRPGGTLLIVGVGTGEPGLLTVRAREAIGSADLVVARAGLTDLVRALARDDADIAEDGAAAAVRAGRVVAVLLDGDPLASAAGTAQVSALTKALARSGARIEIVPGVPTATAALAFAGVSLGGSYMVAECGPGLPDPDWAAIAAAPGTVALVLPAADVAKAALALAEHGRPGDTPASVTTAATTPAQRTVVTTLEAVAEIAGDGGQAVLALGPGVRRQPALSWWESRALYGWTVLVPRTRAQAGELTELLRGYGAQPLEVPTIAVEPPRTPAPMERAIRGLVTGRYAWVAFTSVNAVRAVREKLEEIGLDARAFAGVRVAAVGPSTAASLAAFGIRADLVPSGEQSAAGLLAEWPPYDEVLDMLDRVFLPRADIATEALVAGLKVAGWAVDDVTAYRTVRAAPPPAPIREAIKGGGVDAVLFTSSSTVRNLVGIAGKPHESTVIACIGPATAATATELGLRVDVVASSTSVEVLVADLADFVTERGLTPSRPSRPRRR
jgi:uroporphyrinogen III methyltransferase/synthase